MNKKIIAVQTALEKVDQISARRRELEAEQKTLQSTKIPKLTRLVADGNAAEVNALSIATARSGYGIPQALAALQTEFDAAIHELRQALVPLGPLVAKSFGAEYKRMEEIVIEFLKTHISDRNSEHDVQELTRRIVELSNTVKPLEFLNTRFSGPINQQRLGAESAISRARDAVKNLSHIE